MTKPAKTENDGAGVAFAHQRQQKIVARLRADGRVEASQIAIELGVTGETVRKDLILLERLGRLRRVHGGAVQPELLSYEPLVASRTEFAAEKSRIALAALAHLPEAGSVIIDAGSTTERFAELLPDDRAVTVFTNTLSIAMTLVSKPLVTVFTLGGRVRGQTFAEVDEWTLRALRETNVDVAFLGTNGVNLDRGLTTPDPAEAAVKRAMAHAARRRVLLVDHSKFGLVNTSQHAELTDIDLVITDLHIAPEYREALGEVGVELQLV